MAKNDLVCAKNGISIVVCSTKDCADRNPMILLIVIPSLFEKYSISIYAMKEFYPFSNGSRLYSFTRSKNKSVYL